MTAIEIEYYLSMEHADHSKAKLTNVKYKNGVILSGHFFAKDQDIKTSMQDNKWLYRPVGGDTIQINGDDIESLKVG